MFAVSADIISSPPLPAVKEEEDILPILLLDEIMLERDGKGVGALLILDSGIGISRFDGVAANNEEEMVGSAPTFGGAGVFTDMGVDGGRALDEGCNNEDALLLLGFAVGSDDDDDDEPEEFTLVDTTFTTQSENDKYGEEVGC